MSKERAGAARCPECGHTVNVDEFDELGDTVICDNCNSELEIIKIKPPKLKRVKEAGYDEEGDEDADDFDYLGEDMPDEW